MIVWRQNGVVCGVDESGDCNISSGFQHQDFLMEEIKDWLEDGSAVTIWHYIGISVAVFPVFLEIVRSVY
ncbi:hypothetical protein V2J09_014585 [Rumex salicifolius]